MLVLSDVIYPARHTPCYGPWPIPPGMLTLEPQYTSRALPLVAPITGLTVLALVGAAAIRQPW